MSTPEKVKGLREKRPGVWEWSVFLGRDGQGKTHHRTGTFHGGIRDAKKELRKQQTEVDRGSKSASSATSITVGQVVEEYIALCVTKGRSPKTIYNYRSTLNRYIRPALGRIRVGKLEAIDLDHLYADLTARPLSGATIHTVHCLIGAALAQAKKKWHYVPYNVALDADPPPAPSVEVDPPTLEEVGLIIRSAEARYPGRANLLFFAALTGLRDGELCGLQWYAVDWETHTLAITHRAVYIPREGTRDLPSTKTGKNRRIGLDDLALEVLSRQRHLVDQRAGSVGVTVADNAYIFAENPEGLEPLNPHALGSWTGRIARRHGVNTHIHALRHFHATQAIAAGFDAVTVAARLGNTPRMTLKTYAHPIEQRGRDLAVSAGKMLAPMMALPPGPDTTTT
jgi:integrase